jgi:hypothetical protein
MITYYFLSRISAAVVFMIYWRFNSHAYQAIMKRERQYDLDELELRMIRQNHESACVDLICYFIPGVGEIMTLTILHEISKEIPHRSQKSFQGYLSHKALSSTTFNFAGVIGLLAMVFAWLLIGSLIDDTLTKKETNTQENQPEAEPQADKAEPVTALKDNQYRVLCTTLNRVVSCTIEP